MAIPTDNIGIAYRPMLISPGCASVNAVEKQICRQQTNKATAVAYETQIPCT